MRRCLSIVLLFAALILSAASERALGDSVPAVIMSNREGFAHIKGEFTLGWSFETTSTLVVNQLGVFANNFGGLVESHGVAIWRGGTIVAEATVEGGDGEFSTLINQFRYQALDTPVTLAPGTYTIGAFYGIENGDDDDFVVFSAENFVTIPEVSYKQALFAIGDGLAEPTMQGVNTIGYFGPNFTVIPEPPSLTLASTAALGLIGYRCLRRDKGERRKERDCPGAGSPSTIARRAAGRPVRLEGLEGFVASTLAPLAIGWSDRVAGWELHPRKTSAFPQRTLGLAPRILGGATHRGTRLMEA
jgi:hypothetical protein